MNGELKGILPEIWNTVVDNCEEFRISKHSRSVERSDPLPKPEYSEFLRRYKKSVLVPVKLRRGKSSSVDMPFVRLIDSPGVVVLMKKTLTGTELLNAILLAWPILIFVILSAILSGFVIWFLEHRSNPQMFDPFCPNGVLNGFWWAVVTMTTVGYGDLTPKTLLGRLFTILWITSGLVILAMYMGVVTTSLTTSRLEGTQHFYGITVSVVNQTEEEKFAILHNTNVKVEANELAVIDAVYNSKNNVRLGFIDFYVASYYSQRITQKNLRIVRIIPRSYVYGALLGKDWVPEAVECLRRHSEDNREHIHDVIPKYIRLAENKNDLMEYFSGSVFGYSIYGLSALLCSLLLLGFSFQSGYLSRRRKEPPK